MSREKNRVEIYSHLSSSPHPPSPQSRARRRRNFIITLALSPTFFPIIKRISRVLVISYTGENNGNNVDAL